MEKIIDESMHINNEIFQIFQEIQHLLTLGLESMTLEESTNVEELTRSK